MREPGTKLPWAIWKAPTGEWTVKSLYRDEQGRRCTAWPAICNAGGQDNEANAAYIVHAANHYPKAIEALRELVNAKALAGVRDVVAGWNGENRPDDQRYGRHPDSLGAILPETNCGAVYALDEAMQAARAILSQAKGPQE